MSKNVMGRKGNLLIKFLGSSKVPLSRKYSIFLLFMRFTNFHEIERVLNQFSWGAKFSVLIEADVFDVEKSTFGVEVSCKIFFHSMLDPKK